MKKNGTFCCWTRISFGASARSAMNCFNLSQQHIFSFSLLPQIVTLFCKVFNQNLATITSLELCGLKTLEKTFSLSIEFQDDKFTISIYYGEPQMWCLNEILGRENPQKKLFRERERVLSTLLKCSIRSKYYVKLWKISLFPLIIWNYW